jgi:plasmid maintenance system antidote protein VapI
MSEDRLTTVVAEAVRLSPCSLRALARAANVPDSTLVRIVAGERAATAAVAYGVADALVAWSEECARLARGIRKVQRVSERRGKNE